MCINGVDYLLYIWLVGRFDIQERPVELRDLHPNAIFIQITGNTGTGKSTLMNDLIEHICGEVDSSRECKTGTKECTTETKFIDVSKEIMPLLQEYISANCLFNENIEIFFCDQPGIGGVKVPTRSYFTKYSPGRYDFTIMTTANRITDDEYCIMTHLERYNKEFVVVKTMCDLPIFGMVTEDIKKKRIERKDKFAVQNARLTHFDEIKKEFDQQLKDMLKQEFGAETYYVGIEDNIEPLCLDLEKLKIKLYKWIVYEIQRRGAIRRTENEESNNVDSQIKQIKRQSSRPRIRATLRNHCFSADDASADADNRKDQISLPQNSKL